MQSVDRHMFSLFPVNGRLLVFLLVDEGAECKRSEFLELVLQLGLHQLRARFFFSDRRQNCTRCCCIHVTRAVAMFARLRRRFERSRSNFVMKAANQWLGDLQCDANVASFPT